MKTENWMLMWAVRKEAMERQFQLCYLVFQRIKTLSYITTVYLIQWPLVRVAPLTLPNLVFTIKHSSIEPVNETQ